MRLVQIMHSVVFFLPPGALKHSSSLLRSLLYTSPRMLSPEIKLSRFPFIAFTTVSHLSDLCVAAFKRLIPQRWLFHRQCPIIAACSIVPKLNYWKHAWDSDCSLRFCDSMKHKLREKYFQF